MAAEGALQAAMRRPQIGPSAQTPVPDQRHAGWDDLVMDSRQQHVHLGSSIDGADAHPDLQEHNAGTEQQGAPAVVKHSKTATSVPGLEVQHKAIKVCSSPPCLRGSVFFVRTANAYAQLLPEPDFVHTDVAGQLPVHHAGCF
jgi:hypothetical protein